ncbi:MAG: BamA/TamA family outer membrane protein [Paracoccaceae bacterium]
MTFIRLSQIVLASLQAFVLLLIASTANAQDTLSAAVADNFRIEPEASLGFRKGSFIVAPIPIVDPTIGSGFVVVGGYLFHMDEGSSTSFVGLGALKTDGGSFGYGVSGKLYLSSNRLQFGLTAGRVKLDYDLYVLGIPVPLKQSGTMVNFTGAYGLTSQFSIGTDIRYLDSKLEFAGPLVGGFGSFLDLEILNVGFTADWDRRDDTIFPTSGTHLYFLAAHGFVLDGVINDYDKAILKFDAYKTVFERNVIAFRAATCAATENAPFFDSCALGGPDGFRGYPVTQHISNRLVSFQTAWRGEFSKRFGYSVFGGVGAVGATYEDVFANDYLAAVGIGARYRLSKDFPLTFSVDGTVNREGDKLLYVYIGQRF